MFVLSVLSLFMMQILLKHSSIFFPSWSRSLDLVVRFGNGKIKEWVDIMHMKKVLCPIRVVCINLAAGGCHRGSCTVL